MSFNTLIQQARDNVENIYLKAVADGSLQTVKCYYGYNENGFCFHKFQRGTSILLRNSGVCIKGTTYTIDEIDYYSQLQEILE